ncbi:MAG: rRNA pseudouridine synthase [Streptococcaceae bacterium]|jgi:23S rRNA pseudouridine2605 synthase|nr:rRNA pseudouridine synthase [Streptococcaceae bacterium]
MERLQKVIAEAGIASRRKAEEMIKEGRVSINGKINREMGQKVSSKDVVMVDGVPIYKEEKEYFLFFKPKGVITSTSDEKGRRTVLDFFEGERSRLFPVGRLDWDTTGLLILTNDGDFANKMAHPSHEVEKEYTAKLDGVVTPEALKPLGWGVKIDGKKTKPARFDIINVDPVKKKSVVSLVITEGRNHQVKKMFEAVGFPVEKLKRERVGVLTLKGLRHGEYRPLSKKEVSQLLQGNTPKTR